VVVMLGGHRVTHHEATIVDGLPPPLTPGARTAGAARAGRLGLVSVALPGIHREA